MDSEYIIIEEYCIKSQVDPDFIIQLVEEGLIRITMIDDESYIHISQLPHLEQYTRWHYDLSVNVEGIDIIRTLLDRMEEMQGEMARLRQQLRLMD